jgi:hypothetical protein
MKTGKKTGAFYEKVCQTLPLSVFSFFSGKQSPNHSNIGTICLRICLRKQDGGNKTDSIKKSLCKCPKLN